MLKIRPNGDRVVIRPFKEKDILGSKVSIIVPFDQSKEAAQQGEIVEAGRDATYKVGDKVIFNPSAGDAVKTQDGNQWIELRIMHCDTVHASFEEI